MKADHKNADELFDSLRNSPSELSLEEVNQMIEVLPTMPPPSPDTNLFSNFFNLNNIIMISLPVSIAIALLTMYNWSAKPIVEAPNAPIQELKKIEPSTIENSESLPPAIEQSIEEKASEPVLEKIEPIVSEQKTAPTIIQEEPVERSPKVSAMDDTKSTEGKNYIAYDIPSSKPKNLEELEQYEAVDNDIPKLTDRSLKRLKRTLYQNLVADQLISSKKQYVMMELPGKEIIVNDKPLNEQLYAKYRELTREVGTGKYRKIEMSPDFIKMGNFMEDGFKGHGIGTFTLKEDDIFNNGNLFDSSNEELDFDKDSHIFEKAEDELLEEEMNALKRFAKGILDQKPKRIGKKSLFAVNIKDHKTKPLYDNLQELLLNDGFIESRKDFVLIELPENEVWINGQLLTQEEAQAYEQILADYKIKHGPIRMIRMSEHTISVGDFSEWEFTGTLDVFK